MWPLVSGFTGALTDEGPEVARLQQQQHISEGLLHLSEPDTNAGHAFGLLTLTCRSKRMTNSPWELLTAG